MKRSIIKLKIVPTIWAYISLFSLIITSCGTYTFTTNQGYEVKSILAITETGDTLSVPYKDFIRERYISYPRYQWNNSWYWNNWMYDRWRYPEILWQWEDWYLNIDQPFVVPRNISPQQKTDESRPRINPRSNKSTYKGYNSPKVQTTPNVIQRNNVGSSSNRSIKNNN